VLSGSRWKLFPLPEATSDQHHDSCHQTKTLKLPKKKDPNEKEAPKVKKPCKMPPLCPFFGTYHRGRCWFDYTPGLDEMGGLGTPANEVSSIGFACNLSGAGLC